MDPAVAWLPSSPSVRFLTLTQVLGRSQRSGEVRAARDGIPRGPRIRAVAAARTVFAWVEEKEGWRALRTVAGLPRLHATQEGYAIAVACRLGLAREAAVGRLVERLVAAQWPDGGWNCDPSPAARQSSFHETLVPLWDLAEYARERGHAGAGRAADRAAELLLSHRLFRSHRTGEVADPGWLRFHHPPYWHYDVLHALLILSRCGRVGDPRAGEALDLLEAKRRPEGRWNADGRRYWRPPGSAGSNVEAVDWGPSHPSEFVTLNALRVLRAAGRGAGGAYRRPR